MAARMRRCKRSAEIAAGLIDLEALAQYDPNKRKTGKEAYTGSKLDVEARDLMAEEINLPGIPDGEPRFSDDDEFPATLEDAAANDSATTPVPETTDDV